MKFDFCHQSLNVVLLKSIIASLLIFAKHNGAYGIEEYSSSYNDKKLHQLQDLVNDTGNFGASHKSDIRIHGDYCDTYNLE